MPTYLCVSKVFVFKTGCCSWSFYMYVYIFSVMRFSASQTRSGVCNRLIIWVCLDSVSSIIQLSSSSSTRVPGLRRGPQTAVAGLLGHETTGNFQTGCVSTNQGRSAAWGKERKDKFPCVLFALEHHDAENRTNTGEEQQKLLHIHSQTDKQHWLKACYYTCCMFSDCLTGI